MEDRPARREIVGGRAGRRRDDHPVRTELGDGPAVELDTERRDARERLLVQDGVVQGAEPRRARKACDGDAETEPTVLPELAGKDFVQARKRLRASQAGQESQDADVDAEHGSRRRSGARHREERSVAADDDDQIDGAGEEVPRQTVRTSEGLGALKRPCTCGCSMSGPCVMAKIIPCS